MGVIFHLTSPFQNIYPYLRLVQVYLISYVSSPQPASKQFEDKK